MAEPVNYSDDSIRSLDWKEHIRLRPGMYIG
ncbi:MAG: type topoisomerase subunit [Mucilaginibacter sp.]|nr:type topoisomerase subunit [Mucilaginibacter sp.]